MPFCDSMAQSLSGGLSAGTVRRDPAYSSIPRGAFLDAAYCLVQSGADPQRLRLQDLVEPTVLRRHTIRTSLSATARTCGASRARQPDSCHTYHRTGRYLAGPLPPAPTLKDLVGQGGLTPQPEMPVPGSPLSRGTAPSPSPNPSDGSSTPPAAINPVLPRRTTAPPLSSYAAPPAAPPARGPGGQVIQTPSGPAVTTGGGPGYQTTSIPAAVSRSLCQTAMGPARSFTPTDGSRPYHAKVMPSHESAAWIRHP